MTDNWIGKSISIHCTLPGGVFQGTIKEVTPETITITRAFRNGVPVRKPDTEITISSNNITHLELIPSHNGGSSNISTNVISKPTPIKHPNFSAATNTTGNQDSLLANKMNSMKLAKNGKLSPKYLSKSPSTASSSYNNGKFYAASSNSEPKSYLSSYNGNSQNENGRNVSKPMDIMQPKNGATSTPFKIDKKKTRRYINKNEAFGTPVDDPTMDEDFDFEKNLALFDKQAIWDEIDAIQKPDLLRQTVSSQRQKKYRHDENILSSEPTQYRQIEVDFNSSRDYVTDDGLIIPSIPLVVRNRIQTAAERLGLFWERQSDILARATTDIAIQLLGGARRLTPNNQHQWPTIVVICEEPYNDKKSEVGICTGRQLASHGIKVMIYVKEMSHLRRQSRELDLFHATGNETTYNVKELPSCDLVILAVRSNQISPIVSKWISDNRSPVLAIDPPANGVLSISIKCSILPILPLDDHSSNCGKLYLCNLGIPDKIYRDAGIKYKSPYGHKFVIPIHLVD